jgi:hypothetical protein
MPRGLGVGSATLEGQNLNFFLWGLFGVVEPPLRAVGIEWVWPAGMGWFRPPPFCSLGVAPQTGLWGDLATPIYIYIYVLFYFIFKLV